MGIVLAEARHVPEVTDLLSACMRAMRRNGIYQWDENYPNAEVVSKDVRSLSLYVLEDADGSDGKNRCIAAITLNEEQNPAYQTLHWTGAEPVLVVHRLCVDPTQRRAGIAKRMMGFAEELASERHYASIRLDTNSVNRPALRLYEGLDYRKVGEVYFRGLTTPFFCFEKILHPRENRP